MFIEQILKMSDMEALGGKIAWAFICLLSTPIYVLYCVFVKGMSFHEIVIDDHVQTPLDICAVSFYTYFTYLRLFCGGVSIHTFCENLFFYIGGLLTILWGIYRALSQYEDWKMKKQASKFQKKVFDEANKL